MLNRLRLLLGISIFWLSLSMLFDGMNTLILPSRLSSLVGESSQATALGLLSFLGLLTGMVIQPIAGSFSDRISPNRGRKVIIGLGVLFSLAALALFGLFPGLIGTILGYFAVQSAASVAQAGQQGFIPDLIPSHRRGAASGLKGFMDIGGAMLGFVLLGQLLGKGRGSLALIAIGMALFLGFLLTALLVREVRPAAKTGENLPAEPARILSLAGIFRWDMKQQRPFTVLILSRFLFLLGTYAIGRFLLYFVSNRLGLGADQAAAQTGNLLAGLALGTVLAALPAGWLADRLGRLPLMVVGAVLSAAGSLLLISASSLGQIFLYGLLLSAGSAAFASANWAMTADLAPRAEAARFFGLANFGTAGAAAAAGLLGPLVDWINPISPGAGFSVVFLGAAAAFLASAWVLIIIRGRI